jgi:hypothetical protein
LAYSTELFVVRFFVEVFMKKIIILMILIISTFAYAEPLPKPWYQSNLEQYEGGAMWKDDSKKDRFGYLKSKAGAVTGGDILQNISPLEEWLGRRVRLTALIKTKMLQGSASIFMSIDHGDGYKTFDHAPKGSRREDADWQQFSIVLDVPQGRAAQILFGVRLLGKGEVYFDDFKFEVVSYDVEVTGKTQERERKMGPSNLSFDGGIDRDER